ncbi:hypothetical protein E6C70_10925 [Glaciibacter flavus]|uniref:Uncharacterized protein n=1 Tax=Orlajensenia flava TaxID=2565934 RepID=A0A4S4FT66_9MICO|nr:hypothetical protein [Glaciibacter flavus]THG33939.1 hypothetical protein E6C70_10925 [Glaciibacter flavus]
MEPEQGEERDTAPSAAGAPGDDAPGGGSPDTGSPDTGSPDTGSPHSGSPDSGSPYTPPPPSAVKTPGGNADAVPATNPFGITVPVPIVSDRELGIERAGAHAAGAPPRAGALVAGTASLSAAPGTASRTTTPLIAILAWTGVAVLLVAALVSTIGALNRDLYSAHGFVRTYLSALQSGDADMALSLPGVRIDAAGLQTAGLPADAASTLLRGSVVEAPEDIRLVSDTVRGDGHHRVVYSGVYDGKRQQFTFDVVRDGSLAGVFASWRFATSPMGAMTVSVLHDWGFTVNGLTLDTRAHAAANAPASFSNAASYLVLTPGRFDISRTSPLLQAKEQSVVIGAPGTRAVTVDVQPTPTFVSQVQTEINSFLAGCAKQKVLQPTGCPFGTVIDDRVTDAPVWTIVIDPVVTLVPDDTAFQMPETPGTAHVVVGVQSLFDGDDSTVDRDEPFTMGASVTIAADGTLNIQLH